MRARWLIALVAVLAVAGVVAAVGAAVYWFPQGHGEYSGPGLPYSVAASCELPGHGSWCSQGFEVNTTDFNVTECYSVNSSFAASVWAEFMNQSQYDKFNVNSTLTHMGNQSAPGCWARSFSVGPGPFWFVYLDTTQSPVTVQYTITVVPTG